MAIVGESWGEQEALVRSPFVGTAGQELTRLLQDAGIDRGQCFLTNVLAFRPPNNSMDALCVSRSALPKDYPYAHLAQGKYLAPAYFPELARLKDELAQVNPNCIVAMGNTAAWALLGRSRISAIRGTITSSSVPGLAKVVPTYHPMAVIHQWALRPIVLADLLKAKREAEYPDIRRPKRCVIVNPDIVDVETFVARARDESTQALAVDIETSSGQITHVGFATDSASAICIPFVDPSRPNGSYWPTPTTEIIAWQNVQDLLALPCPKIFQNGLYDLQYFVRQGLSVTNASEDTMLRHHVMYPELQKGLGFLGSVYTSEASWKLLRERGATTMKADDE